MKNLLLAVVLLLPAIANGSEPKSPVILGDSSPSGDGDHAYFEMLATHSNAHYSLGGRSNDEIWPLIWSQPSKYNANEIYYDPIVDAAANRFGVGDGSSGTPWGPGKDERNQFTAISNDTILYYWEARWSDRFTSKDSNNRIGGELETHKAFILLGNLNDDRAVEIRSRFKSASGAEGVGKTDIRQYGSGAGVSPAEATESGDSIAVRDDDSFIVQPNTWTYHWVFIDMNNETLTYWIKDENRGASIVYDNININVNPGLSFIGFEFRHNSSQDGGTAPEGIIWNRNLAVLSGISLSEARSVVSAR